MILDWTVTAVPRPLQTTPHLHPERDHPSPIVVSKGKEVLAGNCLNSVTSVEPNTQWKMPSFVVNVE